MKKWFLLCIPMLILNVAAQLFDKNFSVSIVPLEEITADELNTVIGSTATISDDTIRSLKSNENFEANSAITLLLGAHIRGNRRMKIENFDVNTEGVRHVFQNLFANTIVAYQPYFEVFSPPSQEYLQFQSDNPFIL